MSNESLSPGAIVDVLQLITDLKNLEATPEGQAVLADIAKLVADFGAKAAAAEPTEAAKAE